jgi:hypothetical protein
MMNLKNIKYFVSVAVLLTCGVEARAQFFYDESGRFGSGIFTLNGNAYYTASGGRPESVQNEQNGFGWLRLTDAKLNQLGYVVLDKTFPTTMGVTIEFDFVVWGSEGSMSGGNKSNFSQADGFCVFLIDATKSAGAFDQGGCIGGGLGFMGLSAGPTRGASPTYLGVGIDIKGNFSNRDTQGSNNNPFPNQPGAIPNSIALRTGSVQGGVSRYSYLKGTSSGMSAVYTMPAPPSPAASNLTNNTLSSPSALQPPTSRPAGFYRRARINFDPIANGGVKVSIYLKFSENPNSGFQHVFTYDYAQSTIAFRARPDTMRVAFSATTGAETAFHDIRNVLIRTPGVLTVAKQPIECPPVSSIPNTNTRVQTTIACISNSSHTITVKDTLPHNFVVQNSPIAINQGQTISGVFQNLSSATAADGRTVYTYTLTDMGATYENIHVTYDGYFNAIPSGGTFTTGAGITNVSPVIPAVAGVQQITNARYTGSMPYIAAVSPAAGAVSYQPGVQQTFTVSGASIVWESSIDNGATWQNAGAGNSFTPSASLFNLPTFKLRCTAGTGNCTAGPLEYTCTAVVKPEIALRDSCSLHPYLTVKYQYQGMTFQWYKSPAVGPTNWTAINGATTGKLYITDDALYKVVVSYGGLSGESKTLHCKVKKTKLHSNLWWYNITSEYN